jgi:hypothetical protein
MCPVCLTTAALVAAGTGTGTVAGLAALIIGTRRPERAAPAPKPAPQPKEK